MRKRKRLLVTFTLAGGGVAFLAAPAGAHVTPDKDEVPNDAYDDVTLTVPHGCEEAPTAVVTVHIPEGVTNISPQVNPGWEIEMVTEELDEPLEGPYGDEITEQVTEVIYTADEGNELPDEYRDDFTIGFRTTFTEPGDYLFFKTIQTCDDGAEETWIEEYVEGVTEGEEPDGPSPVLLVTEAEPESGEADIEAEAAAETDGELAAAEESSSDDDSTGLAVAGIVVGVLGLAVGGTALFRTRSAG